MTDTLLKPNGETTVLLTITEASAALRISRWKLYDLIRNGTLETTKIGRRRFVPRDALAKLIDELREELH